MNGVGLSDFLFAKESASLICPVIISIPTNFYSQRLIVIMT
jgi:hypothetical protein